MTNSKVVKTKGGGWVAFERTWEPDTHERRVLITFKQRLFKGKARYAVVTPKKAQEIREWLDWFLKDDDANQ